MVHWHSWAQLDETVSARLQGNAAISDNGSKITSQKGKNGEWLRADSLSGSKSGTFCYSERYGQSKCSKV
jgi:hypothetical protein